MGSVLVAACATAVVIGIAPTATAQERLPAVVTEVVDGDTVGAQLSDGRTLGVRLIGIDTPERDECGADRATEYLEGLVNRRAVTLVSDPTQPAADRFGRSLFYVDRDDGLDVGREMVGAGWAEVSVVDAPFDRIDPYLDAEFEAENGLGGVWRRCGGDFHRSIANELRESALAFMYRYYARVSNRQFVVAWRMLGRRTRRQLGPFRTWRAGHRRSLGVAVLSARARLARGRAVVSVHIRSRDRDACNGRVVRQFFRGSWVLAPRRGSWAAAKVRMRKTAGGRVRLSKSECPAPKPPPTGGPQPRPNCDPNYSGCLDPNALDYDCAGGSGDGPKYAGRVEVLGDDHYGLDSDGDGIGCED